MSTCPELTTPSPPLTLRLEGLKLGQRALFTCPVGYTIEGVSNATCLASGNLSRTDTIRILILVTSIIIIIELCVILQKKNKLLATVQRRMRSSQLLLFLFMFAQEIGHRHRPHAIPSNVLRYFWKIRIWVWPNWTRQHTDGPYSSARGDIGWTGRPALNANPAAHGMDQYHDVEVCSQPNSPVDTCCRHASRFQRINIK